MIPKNLNWFRSLLELTLPEEQKGDSMSVTTNMTITTDVNSLSDNYTSIAENNTNEKIKPVNDEKASSIRTFEKNVNGGRELSIKNRLKVF